VWSYLSSLIISFVAFSFCLSCCLFIVVVVVVDCGCELLLLLLLPDWVAV